jgi:hypothetical protein
VARAWRRRRFACLFVSLVLTLAAGPILDAFGWDPDLLEAFLALNLVAAVVGAAAEIGPRAFLALGAVSGVAVAARVLSRSATLFPLPAGSLVALLALAAILRAVLRRGPVNSERLFAALSAYLLFGVMCGVGYWVFDQAWPGSLVWSARPAAAALGVRDAIYFSFVTLATLGYGDLVPASPPARALAIAEAVGGQLYLVVMVARLVTLYARPGGGRDGDAPGSSDSEESSR